VTGAAPLAAAALLLAAGGLAKLVRPDGTVRALSSAALPGGRMLVRLGAVAEVAVGAGALLIRGPWGPAAVAAAYLLFVAFLARSMQTARGAGSCGCFGATDAPPSRIHVGVDVAAAGAALTAAVTGWPGLGDVLGSQPGAGLPFLFLVAITSYLAYLVLTALPAILTVDQVQGARP
jgi:hypothetical protein